MRIRYTLHLLLALVLLAGAMRLVSPALAARPADDSGLQQNPTPPPPETPPALITPPALPTLPPLGPTLTPPATPEAPLPEPSPPGPIPPITTEPVAEPALITVVVLPDPNQAAAPGDLLSWSIVATNRGRGTAKEATLTLPLGGLPLEVIDASLSRPGAWVSSRSADGLVIRSGALGAGDTLTATLRVRVSPGAASGTALGARVEFRWSDKAGSGSGRSNLPIVRVAATAARSERYLLAAEPAEPGSALRFFNTTIFAPGEPVTFWYTPAGGAAAGLDTLSADSDGALFVEFDTAGLDPGRYTLSARGNWTGFVATGDFTLP